MPDILAQPLEENEKRELDSPEPSVEKQDDRNACAKVTFRPLGKICGWWIELPGRDGDIQVQILFEHLPRDGVGQEEDA